MSSQDQIVANYVALTTTDAELLVTSVLAYHKNLSDPLFEMTTLDNAHKQEVRNASKTSLIKLRQRLELLGQTVRLATQAPDI